MTLTQILQMLPEWVDSIGAAMAGAISVLGGLRLYNNSRRKSQSDILKEYKEMYIQASMESLELARNDSTRRRILINMRAFCPDCYESAIKNLKIDEKFI